VVILFFPYFRVIHPWCIQKSTFAELKYYRCAAEFISLAGWTEDLNEAHGDKILCGGNWNKVN
jgi:hypothetical protein